MINIKTGLPDKCVSCGKSLKKNHKCSKKHEAGRKGVDNSELGIIYTPKKSERLKEGLKMLEDMGYFG